MGINEDKKNIIQNCDDSLLQTKNDFTIERKSEIEAQENKIFKKEDDIEIKTNKTVLSNKKQINSEQKNIDELPKEEKNTTFSRSSLSDLPKKTEDLQTDNKVINQKKENINTDVMSHKSISANNYSEDTEDNFVMNVNEQNSNAKDFLSAMFSKNPVFVLMLGLGPALAVTTKLTNGISLGLIVLITTLLSNVVVSSLKGFIPSQIRLPFYLTITGSFVSIIIIFVQAFFPDVVTSLGIFLPLTAVNSVVLERAEVFSCKKKIANTVLNSLGTGIGFMLVLILISFIREFFGTLQLDFSDFGLGVYNFGKISILGIPIYEHAKIFIMPAGAFLTLGILLAIKQAICNYSNKNIEE